MKCLESMMLYLAQSLGFTPTQAEIRTAKSEFFNVPDETVADLSQRLLARSRVISEAETVCLAKNIHMLMLSTINYRVKMTVHECRMNAQGYCFYICPRCRSTLERDYQAYCDRCGQHLDWRGKVETLRMR